MTLEPISDPELLDFHESSALLKLKESTLRAWVLKKRLPYVKLGRRVFLRRSDLLNLITNSLVPAKRDITNESVPRVARSQVNTRKSA